MMLTIYRLLLRASGPALRVLLAVRRLQGLEEKGHVREKTGRAGLPRPSGKLVWIHAASNGEMLSSLPLVREILARDPDAHCLITTVTLTAARLVRRLSDARIMHQYAPLDHPVWVRRFLDHWKPDAVLWMESELWPLTLAGIHARGIPLAMVNGRLSERSARRWARFPRTIAQILSWFDAVLAQSDGDAARLTALGAHAQQAGNIKYAASALPCDETQLKALRAQTGKRPLLLMASTHEGEEEIAAHVYKTLSERFPDLLVVVLPRHPGRGEDIAALFAQHGLKIARRSAHETIVPETQIYLADTLGEAGLFYRLADIAFVGNSLPCAPGGGHNLLEPAHLNCAILHGPCMWNFSEIERDLRAAGGSLTVQDADDLAIQAAALLQDASRCRQLADAALAFVQQQDQVLIDVTNALRPVLSRAGITP